MWFIRQAEIVLFFTWLTIADFGLFREVQYLLRLIGAVLFIIITILKFVCNDRRARIEFGD